MRSHTNPLNGYALKYKKRPNKGLFSCKFLEELLYFGSLFSLYIVEHFFQKYYVFCLSLLCGIFFLIGSTSVSRDSVTIDEVAHIVSGYSTLSTLNFTLNTEHPPLVKIIAALPLLLQPIDYSLSTKHSSSQWEEGTKLLFTNGNDTDTLLFWSRVGVLLFHTLLLFLCGMLLRSFLPSFWGLGAVFFIASEPTILAHSRYVTTDVGVALLTVLVVLSSVLLLQKPTKRHFFYTLCSMAAILVTKFSGVLVVVYTVFCMLVYALWRYRSDKQLGNILFKKIFSLFGGVVVMVYLFYTIFNLHTPLWQIRSAVESSFVPAPIKQFELMLAEYPLMRGIPSYISGFDYASNRSIQKSEATGVQFLDGEFKTGGQGWWYYFLKAFLYKESPSILVLSFLSMTLGGYYLWKRKPLGLALGLLVGCGGVYLFLSCLTTLNIGIRHISLVLVLIPLIGVWLVSLWEYRYRSIILGLLMALQIYTIASTYPFYLSYMNDLSGGSLQGYKHLSDSNVDWGQNMRRLSEWAESQGLERVYVDYWGKTPLNYYDPKNILQPWHGEWGRPQGVFAILPSWIEQSKWMKTRGLMTTDYSYLEGLPLYAEIGKSIFVYDLR